MSNVVLIVEDELITADSIVRLLKDEGYEILGPVSSAEEALTTCHHASHVPDIALCDIRLKNSVKGTQLAMELKQRYACEIVFTTAHANHQTVTDALLSDPAMYVVKPFTDKQLLVAVQLAFHRLFTQRQPGKHPVITLTNKETEILSMIARGMTTKQIAYKLKVSPETIKTHRKRMLRKNNTASIPLLVYNLGITR